jgi:hypothetical protein
LQAAEQAQGRQSDLVHAVQLELEQVRYEVRLVARQYEATDPDNRLVASEANVYHSAAL